MFQIGNRKFKVNVSGGHVLCGDNARMDVTYRTGREIVFQEICFSLNMLN